MVYRITTRVPTGVPCCRKGFRVAELAGGPAALQELFVNTLELVKLSPDASIRSKGIQGTYDGAGAVLEIVSPIEGNKDEHYLYVEDSVRFMVYEDAPEGDGRLITDFVITRSKDSPSWFAETGV